MRTKNSQIGPIRKLVLKLITKLQEKTINCDNLFLYSLLTKLHFRIYTGVSLEEVFNTASSDALEMFHNAAERHSKMVVSLIYGSSSKTHKKMLKNLAYESFCKNFLLEQEL